MVFLEGVPIEQDALRLRNEFLELPGLAVTVPQIARLFGVRLQHAEELLQLLAREGFLLCDERGLYRRAGR